MPFEPVGSPVGACESGGFGPAVEMGEIFEVDVFDVAADAAFGEGKRHPGFEMCKDFRVGVRMRGKKEIQPIGPGGHQRL